MKYIMIVNRNSGKGIYINTSQIENIMMSSDGADIQTVSGNVYHSTSTIKQILTQIND